LLDAPPAIKVRSECRLGHLGLGIVDPRDVILRFLGHGRDVILRLLGHGVVTMPARGAMDVRDAVIIVVVLNDLSKRDRGRAGQ